MFKKLVAIEPVSLIPSAEKKLQDFAKEVIMYDDIPSGDEEVASPYRGCGRCFVELHLADWEGGTGKVSERPVYRDVLLALLAGKRECRYLLCERTGYRCHRYPRLWR